MPHIIPCQTELSDRFPVASFAVNVPSERYFEIAFATDPSLFHPGEAPRRTARNFYTSRSSGLMRAPAGQATYLLPSQQLRRFAGRSRLHYALATYDSPRGEDPRVSVSFDALDKTPFVRIAQSFSGRTLDRSRLTSADSSAASSNGAYGAKTGVMNWGGDLIAGSRASDTGRTAFEYDDGYDPSLWQTAAAQPQSPEAASGTVPPTSGLSTTATNETTGTYGSAAAQATNAVEANVVESNAVESVPGADNPSCHAEAYGSVTGPLTPGLETEEWAPGPAELDNHSATYSWEHRTGSSMSSHARVRAPAPEPEPDGWEDGAAYRLATQQAQAPRHAQPMLGQVRNRSRYDSGNYDDGDYNDYNNDGDYNDYNDDDAWDSAASALGDTGSVPYNDDNDDDDLVEVEPEPEPEDEDDSDDDDFGIDEGYTGRRAPALRPPVDPPNARRLDPLGKAHLLYAVSDLHGEAQPFAKWAVDEQGGVRGARGVCYGIGSFDQQSGALGALLRRCHNEDPAGFAEIYGNGWQHLLEVTNAASPRARLSPVAGAHLADPVWRQRFSRAAEYRPFQRAQLKEAAARYVDPNLGAAARLGLHRDRALAALVDRCMTLGNAAGVADMAETLCPVKRADLRAGDQRALDDTLTQLGYGAGTVSKRLRAWQRDRGVAEGGRFGPETQIALIEALRAHHGAQSDPGAVAASLASYGGGDRFSAPEHPYLHDHDYALAEYA